MILWNILWSQKVAHLLSLRWCFPSISGGSNSDQPRPKQIHLWWEILHMYANINNVPEFVVYLTEYFVSINHNWPKCCVTQLTVLLIKARTSLLFICHDSIFVLTWATSCFFHFDKIFDEWWLRRIWLPHIVTWVHGWMETLYGNHIMTLRW